MSKSRFIKGCILEKGEGGSSRAISRLDKIPDRQTGGFEQVLLKLFHFGEMAKVASSHGLYTNIMEYSPIFRIGLPFTTGGYFNANKLLS